MTKGEFLLTMTTLLGATFLVIGQEKFSLKSKLIWRSWIIKDRIPATRPN